MFLEQLVICPNRLLCIRARVRTKMRDGAGERMESKKGRIELVEGWGLDARISDLGRGVGGWMADVL